MVNMKGQLTRCKNGKLKIFDCDVILVAFALEMVLILRPQSIVIDKGGSRDPCFMRWVYLMARHGGDDAIVRYTTFFF